MEQSWFSIGRTGTRCSGSVEAASALFARDRALLSRPGVSDDLLTAIDALTARTGFVAQAVEGLGHRHIEKPELAGTAIKLALNRPEFIHWVQAVTGCGPVGRIEAMVVETRPGGADQLDWHNDTHAHIVLGVTIHLGAEPYAGGAFELRDVGADGVRFRHAGAQRGDVLLFDVDPAFDHRVMPVTAGAARRVFTGWLIAAGH